MANKIKIKRQKKGRQSAGQPRSSSSPTLLQQALAFHQAGHLPQAEALYRQILATEPNHPGALQYLGVLAHQTGKSEIGVKLLSKALSRRPDSVDAYVSLGVIFHDLGRLEEAVANFHRALRLKPDYAELHYNLGNALKDQGKLEEAAVSFRRAIRLKPDDADAYGNLGAVLQARGELAEAAAKYRQALRFKPDDAVVHYNLGKIKNDIGNLNEAIVCYRQALRLKPDFVEAYNNLGNVLRDQGKLGEAVANFQKALVLKPGHASAHCNLGSAFQDQGKLEEAEASYFRALALEPNLVEAHNNLGNVLKDQGKLAEAVSSYRRALALKPDFVEAYNNLGNALKAQGELGAAVLSYRKALSLKPDYVDAHSNLLLCLHYLPSLSSSDYFGEARGYGRQAASQVSEPFSDWHCSPTPERLRVGLVSGDFRNHPVGYFLEGLLANIDPNRIELIAYPTHQQEDELTARIRSCFVAWTPLQGMKDEMAARLIHTDGVHVLLDLAGHTANNCLPIFAWKPAPVQVSWLGYSASTGLAEMDYLLADPYVVPLEDEGHFTETIWRLPESYLCFCPPQAGVELGPLPALAAGRIVFGSFNNPTKMNDSVVALWAKVLHAVPDSRLFLKARPFSELTVAEATRHRFEALGIAPERLLLEGYVPRREEHLAAYNRVDIALDPFPYNGTTTSVEGLWMGVPFLTRQGDRFVSRVSESIARNAGLADWVATDDEDYVAKAAAHASDLEKLARLRAGLREQVLASPVFDAPRFVRNFETALWGMWNERGKGGKG